MAIVPINAGFPESLLATDLPDYAAERFWLWIKLAGVAVFFLILLPPMFAEKVEVEPNVKSEEELTVVKEVKRKKSGKGSKKVAKAKLSPSEKSLEAPMEENPEHVISQRAVMGCCAAFVMAFVVIIIHSSPDNNYTPKGVFQAPLFTPDECQHILNMANAAAMNNYERAVEAKEAAQIQIVPEGDEENDNLNKTVKGLLQEPVGWQKFRHITYPTTDLNLVTDPFNLSDQQYIREKLDARLSPLLERIFGIPASSVRANDMFVVRYDAGMRTLLKNHTDDGHISFNVLLTEDFEGGGTRFWNRFSKSPFAHVQPTRAGQVLLHSAEVNHEGMEISRGTRIVLVGFLDVDRVDPFTGEWTGLPWLASWGSLTWSMIKFKHGIKASDIRVGQNTWSRYPGVIACFANMYRLLMWLGDMSLPHFVVNLVSEADRDTYLASLDEAFERRKKLGVHNQASWFRGQQISVDINGEIAGKWNTRISHDYRFSSIEL